MPGGPRIPFSDMKLLTAAARPVALRFGVVLSTGGVLVIHVIIIIGTNADDGFIITVDAVVTFTLFCIFVDFLFDFLFEFFVVIVIVIVVVVIVVVVIVVIVVVVVVVAGPRPTSTSTSSRCSVSPLSSILPPPPSSAPTSFSSASSLTVPAGSGFSMSRR